MFEAAVTSTPSIWASMNSWFTPTVLFLFLNLMIGTIYVTSSLANTHKHGGDHHQNHHQFARSPSVLQRLKSINFYSYRSPEPNTVTCEKSQLFGSRFTVHQSPQEIYHQNQPFFSRSPSMLQRLKSINLNNYFYQEQITPSSQKITPETTSQTPFVQEQEQEHENGVSEEEEEKSIDEIFSKINNVNKANRSKSDTKPATGAVPKKFPKKMKKSASSKSAFAHFDENEIVAVESRRPDTVREGKSKMADDDDDAEVDAKADDFINRFKQQLKLQRIDSIMRYKDMIHRGT